MLVPAVAIVLQAIIHGIIIVNASIFLALFVLLVVYLKELGISQHEKETRRKFLRILVMFFSMTVCMGISCVTSMVTIEQISQKKEQSDSMVIANLVKRTNRKILFETYYCF